MYKILSFLFYLIFFLNSFADFSDFFGFKESIKTDEEYYQNGMYELSTKSYKDALDEFESLRMNYPFSKYSENSFLIEPFLLYLMGDFDKIEPIVVDFMAKYPRSENLKYMIYMRMIAISELAMKYENDESLMKDGIRFCEYIIQNYNRTLYSEKSRVILEKLQNLMYQHELDIADYYYQKGDFISAISRYSNILNYKFLKHSEINFLNSKINEIKDKIVT